MRKLMSVAVLALFGLGSVVLAAAPPAKTSGASAPSTAPKTVTLDLRKDLPKTLTLNEGDQVVFANDVGTFTVKDTDGKGKLFEPRPHNTFNQAAAYKVTRVGTGEITVYMTHQGLLQVARTQKIQVTVNPVPAICPAPMPIAKPAPKPGPKPIAKPIKQTVNLDLHNVLPKTITVKVGDHINLVSGARSRLQSSKIKATDGKTGDLLQPRNRMHPTSSWVAQRAGTGTLEVTVSAGPNATGVVHTITVTVTP